MVLGKKRHENLERFLASASRLCTPGSTARRHPRRAARGRARRRGWKRRVEQPSGSTAEMGPRNRRSISRSRASQTGLSNACIGIITAPRIDSLRLDRHEASKHMPYITSIERRGQGRQEGRQKVGVKASRRPASGRYSTPLSIRLRLVPEGRPETIEQIEIKPRFRQSKQRPTSSIYS